MSPKCYSGCAFRKHKHCRSAQKLTNEPYSYIYKCRYGQEQWYDENGDKRNDSAFGKHQHIGGHYTGNCSRCTNGRNC